MGLVPSDTSCFERKACNIFKSPFVSEVIELFSKTEEKIKSVNQLRLSRRRVKHKQDLKKKKKKSSPAADVARGNQKVAV